MTRSGLHSRPDKLSHAEIVLYEIDMLRFAKGHLLAPIGFRSEGEEWLCLEAFLLHYRNLIEFFSGRPRLPDDLSIARPQDIWRSGPPDNPTLASMTRLDLYEKYDTRDNPEAISKYLHHCTQQRAIKKEWNVRNMYEDLRPVIEQLESLLPEYKPATKSGKPKEVVTIAAEGQSTATTRVIDHGQGPSGALSTVFEKPKEPKGD